MENTSVASVTRCLQLPMWAASKTERSVICHTAPQNMATPSILARKNATKKGFGTWHYKIKASVVVAISTTQGQSTTRLQIMNVLHSARENLVIVVDSGGTRFTNWTHCR